MIVHPCLRCSLQNLPIEQLRCPRCGEENFIPLNRTWPAPESSPDPINETTGFCDASTQQIEEAKDIQTSSNPNQYEQTKPIWKDINLCNVEHRDGIERSNIEVELCERPDETKLRCRNTDLKAGFQLQNCSNDPAAKKNALQDIPTAYDQAISFNTEYNDVCHSASVNFSASVSAHGEEPKSRMNFSHLTQSKLENQPSIEMSVERRLAEELSQLKSEESEIDFAGCHKCLNRFVAANFSRFNMLQQSECDLKPYKCKKCLCKFSSRSKLHDHQKVHSEERPYKCDHCGYSSKDKKYLKAHILHVHTEK